jgi:hypothetical protein
MLFALSESVDSRIGEFQVHRLLISSTFVVSLFMPVALEAQSAHLVIGGNLLGRVPGLCEVSPDAPPNDQACAPHTESLGGVLGLRDTLTKIRENDKDVYVVLTGNNLPLDFRPAPTPRQASFLDAFHGLKADAVAIGQDDLLRAVVPVRLEDGNRTADETFTPAIRDYFANPARRFVGSNLFIRTHKKGLNVVESGDYVLKIPADSSVAWTTTTLSIQLPPNVKDDELKGDKVQVLVGNKPFDAQRNGRTLKIKELPPFAPGSTVEVSAKQFKFHFLLDTPLTPWNQNTGSLQGLPVAILGDHGGSPLAVAAVVDPAVLSVFDPARWKFRDGKDKETEYEFVALPVADTLKAVAGSLKGVDALPVLITDLPDNAALEAAASSTLWKVVSFNPDSHVLGCMDGEAGCLKGRKPPYDLGTVGLMDTGTQRRVFARPEWDGETLVDLEARRTGPDWEFSRSERLPVPGYAPVRPVAGQLLTRSATTNAMDVKSTQSQTRTIENLLPAYPDRPVWWDTREHVAITMMDALRKEAGAEIAIVDARGIDEDVVEEFNREYMTPVDPQQPLDPGNRLRTGVRPFEVMQMLWRYDAYVRVILKGSDITTLLAKLGAVSADDDGGAYCIRGLNSDGTDVDCGIPAKIDDPDAYGATLRMNGRYFDKAMAYSVVLPQALANTQPTDYVHRRQFNAFAALHAWVNPAPRIPPPSPAAPAATISQNTPADFTNSYEKKLLSLFYIPSAAVEIGGQDYHVPVGDLGGFQAIPNVGEKPQHTFKFNLTGELHIVPVDLRHVTLDLFSRETLNRLDTYPQSAGDLKQIAYTPDVWTNGAVLSSRIVTDALSSQFDRLISGWFPKKQVASFRIEPFVGYFDDSSIFHFDTFYKSKRTDPAGNNYLLHQQDRKPNYAYLGYGVGLTDITLSSHFKLKGTSIRRDEGINYAQPTALTIGATTFDLDHVRRCGIQTLIDGGKSDPCTQAADLAGGPPVIAYTYRTIRQSREQLTTSLEFTAGSGAHKITLTAAVKAYRWAATRGGYLPLDPLWSTESTFSSTVPLWYGLSVGPYARYLIVKAYGSPGTYESSKYGFTMTLPVFGKAGHGSFLY